MFRCIHSAWKNLRPFLTQNVHNDELDDITETEILSLAGKLDLDVQVDDVLELIDNHEIDREVTKIRKKINNRRRNSEEGLVNENTMTY